MAWHLVKHRDNFTLLLFSEDIWINIEMEKIT
jgi:hypothetical protein